MELLNKGKFDLFPGKTIIIFSLFSPPSFYVEEKKNSLYEQHLLIPLFHEDFVELSIARKN